MLHQTDRGPKGSLRRHNCCNPCDMGGNLRLARDRGASCRPQIPASGFFACASRSAAMGSKRAIFSRTSESPSCRADKAGRNVSSFRRLYRRPAAIRLLVGNRGAGMDGDFAHFDAEGLRNGRDRNREQQAALRRREAAKPQSPCLAFDMNEPQATQGVCDLHGHFPMANTGGGWRGQAISNLPASTAPVDRSSQPAGLYA